MKNSSKRNNNIYIVGGGIIGASIAYSLSKYPNYNIFILEKNKVSSGSTNKSGGFIRCFHTNEQINHFAVESYNDFKQMENEINFIKNGCLYLYNQMTKENTLQQFSMFKSRYDYSVIKVNREQGKLQFPFINWDSYEGGIFEPEAGYINPKLLTEYWIQKAKENNVNVRENTKVIDFEIEDNCVTKIKCDNGDFEDVDQLILATGAWSNPLLQKLNENQSIFVKSIQINYFKKKIKSYKQVNVIDSHSDLYMRDVDENYVFAGLPTGECLKNLDTIDNKMYPSVNQENLVTNAINHEFNNFLSNNWKENGLKSFDGYTSNGIGLFYNSKINNNLLVASGWNGGGVKISPFIGKKVSQIVLEKCEGK